MTVIMEQSDFRNTEAVYLIAVKAEKPSRGTGNQSVPKLSGMRTRGFIYESPEN